MGWLRLGVGCFRALESVVRAVQQHGRFMSTEVSVGMR